MFDFVRNESLIQVGADTQVTGVPTYRPTGIGFIEPIGASKTGLLSCEELLLSTP